MKTIPQPVEISSDLMKKLRKAEEGKRSINMLVQMFQEQAEGRISQLNKEVQQTWMEIARAHDIDMDNVLWVPQPTGNKIMPAQIKLIGEKIE